MKVIIFLVLLSISMQPTSAYATDALIPKETLLIIEAKAAVDFPNDYSKQEDVIKAQTTAYAEIKNYKNENVPVKILENLKIKAAQDFPLDYRIQLSNIIQQVYSYITLGRLSRYSFAYAPAKLIEKLKIKAARNFPLDYRFQLSIILQQVNSDLKLSRYSLHSIVTDIEKCEDLKWRLGNKGGQEYYYWGTLKPGSADVIYVVGLFGQNFGFPNPDGTWEITVWDDYKVENTRREKFACEKY
jgi:hypothetical protein